MSRSGGRRRGRLWKRGAMRKTGFVSGVPSGGR